MWERYAVLPDRVSRTCLVLGLWLDAPAEQRFARAIARDGDAYAPHWQRWAEQEERHIAVNDPAALADLVYDDSPSAARTSASSR